MLSKGEIISGLVHEYFDGDIIRVKFPKWFKLKYENTYISKTKKILVITLKVNCCTK